MIEHLNDESQTVRWKTTLALSKFGNKALNPLKQALITENSTIREKAAETLGSIGDPLALDDLKIALDDENIYVRKSAEEAIKNIISKSTENS